MGEYNKQNEYEEKNKRAEGKTLRTNISQHAYSICFGFYLATKHLRIISFPLKKKQVHRGQQFIRWRLFGFPQWTGRNLWLIWWHRHWAPPSLCQFVVISLNMLIGRVSSMLPVSSYYSWFNYLAIHFPPFARPQNQIELHYGSAASMTLA